ncbi:MAG: PH domain-containing protein [Chloroflexota bacterium]
MANQSSNDPEIAQFITEDQDPEQVAKAYNKVQQILTSGEKVLYIAIQKPLTVDMAPDVVILTNRRFIDYRPNMFGQATFKDYIWRDLREAVLTEHVMRATLTMYARDGQELRIENLVKAQARRLYAIAQEMEENVREEIRLRQMEEKRAEAGGIVLQHTGAQSASTAAPAEEPLQALSKLKQLLDAGLITSAEFETKKAEILSRL